MFLLRGPRLASALTSANEALEHGEVIAARLNVSLNLLRSSRDALAEKMRCDAAAVLNRPGADPQTEVVVSPEPPVVQVWKFL